MNRSELSPQNRRSLTRLMGVLFDGGVVAFGDDSKVNPRKFLCFRMAGEEMPIAGNMSEPGEAGQSMLFVSGEIYRSGQGPGDEPADRVWLGAGELADILMVLDGLFGDVPGILERVQHELSVHAAINSKRNAINGPSLIQVAYPGAPMSRLADEIFEAYDFGVATVQAHDGWSSTTGGFETVMCKVVYVSYPDDPPEADSHKVSFQVTLVGTDVLDAHACEMRYGNEIGQRGDKYVKPELEVSRER